MESIDRKIQDKFYDFANLIWEGEKCNFHPKLVLIPPYTPLLSL